MQITTLADLSELIDEHRELAFLSAMTSRRALRIFVCSALNHLRG
jgi:hypothetical protein